MRLDPKYFNRFIGVTAAFAFLLILYFSLRHASTQKQEFESDLRALFVGFDPGTLTPILDRRGLESEVGTPMDESPSHSNDVYVFWASWSGKSLAVLDTLRALQAEDASLRVTALAVKDDPASIHRAIEATSDRFLYAEGTDLYGEWAVPGVPTLILGSSDPARVEAHVGVRPAEIRSMLLRSNTRE